MGGAGYSALALKANVHVYFKSADGYYESWDLASALHPQTLMAYQKMVAPVGWQWIRLASPIKLGYKLSKWVTQIKLVSDLLPAKGLLGGSGLRVVRRARLLSSSRL